MTSRERIMAALNHRETDRIPVDFAGHLSSGISAIAYARLRKYLGLPDKPIRVHDPGQQLAIVDEDMLDRFGVDTIELGRGFAHDEYCWADWVLPDGTPCRMPEWSLPERADGEWVMRDRNRRVISRMPDGALYFEQTYYPFAENGDPETLSDVLSLRGPAGSGIPGPLAEGPNGARTLASGAKRLRERTARAILGIFGGNLFEFGQSMYRNDNFFMLLASEPLKAHRFLDKLMEIHLAALERFLGAVGEYIDIIVFGDDLGMQTGPLISPRMYREFFKPRHAFLWNRAKELADVKVNLHSCGGIRELIPDLIEAGLDAVNPVQITCTGMELDGLRRDFGKDLVFWGGGCDTRSILPDGTPDSISKHVREQCALFGNNGGFVFQQVHNIQANVPPENIVAMFEAVNS
ncbi:methyltransferase [bacterium]|nr:methyltransferase [bacterium]